MVLCYLNHNGIEKHQMRFVEVQKGKWDVRECFAWPKLLVKAWAKENPSFSPNPMRDVGGDARGFVLCRAEQALCISLSICSNMRV